MSFSISKLGKLYIIGGGRMGEAILAGILKSQFLEPAQVLVVDPNEARCNLLSSEYGVLTQQDMSGIKATADDLVLLSVKPQSLPELLQHSAYQMQDALIISIAVGISTHTISGHFSKLPRLVKVMPNTPALVSQGVALVSAHEGTSKKDEDLVIALFESIGTAYAIDESKQNAGAAISGSGPAYFALIVDALTRAGVKQGLTRELSERLAVETMAGTAALLSAQTSLHPEQLVDMVSSPGGTTIEAVAKLEDYKVRAAFSAAIEAAVRRAEEL